MRESLRGGSCFIPLWFFLNHSKQATRIFERMSVLYAYMDTEHERCTAYRPTGYAVSPYAIHSTTQEAPAFQNIKKSHKTLWFFKDSLTARHTYFPFSLPYESLVVTGVTIMDTHNYPSPLCQWPQTHNKVSHSRKGQWILRTAISRFTVLQRENEKVMIEIPQIFTFTFFLFSQ